LTVQFPAIRPSERELTPAVLPQAKVRTESRRTSRWVLANDGGGATVALTFANITDAWAESIRQTHSLSKGTYDSLVLPPELWAGDPELEAFLAGAGAWRFAEPPQIEWQKRGRTTVTVRLVQKRRDALPGFNPNAPPLLPWIPPTVPDPGPIPPLGPDGPDPPEPDIPDTWTMAWVSIEMVENANSFYETTYTVSSQDGDSYATSYPLSIDTGLGAQGSVNSGNLYQQIYAIPVDETSMLVVPAPKLVYRNNQTPDLSAFYTVYSEVGTNFTNRWTMLKYAYLSTRNDCVEVPITQALADGLWAWRDQRWLGLTAGNPNPFDPFMDYGDPSIYSLVPTVNWRPVTAPGSAFNDVQLASATDPIAWYTFVNAGPPRNLLIGEAQPATVSEWVRSGIGMGYGYIASSADPAELVTNSSFRPAIVTTLSQSWRPQLLAQFGVSLP
jgi:hypothetical protein